MRRIFTIFLVLACLALMAGCAVGPGGTYGPFSNTSTIQTSDGRWVTQSHDMSGTVAANIMGTVVNAGASALNMGLATNWGRGFPYRRQYMYPATYPSGMFSGNWGSYGYGGYVPYGGILVH